MKNLSPAPQTIHTVSNFEALVATTFQGDRNAICWTRELPGDFAEIVNKVALNGNITELTEADLLDMQLSEQGQLARQILLNDLQLLKAHGALPCLNIIKYYERDEDNPFFPTDVYSFHVDRSPVPTDTFLCTYYGEPSELLLNAEAEQKVLVPEIREELKKQYGGTEEGFALFLSEHFLDLHYRAKPNANPISLGIGHLWRLAVDYPESTVLPCIHRAPEEKAGQPRLLLIC